MKTTQRITVRLITLSCLLALPVGLGAQTTETPIMIDYTGVSPLLKDFLTPSVKPNKSFDYWIDQLENHIPEESFEPFKSELKRALKRPTSKKVLKVFTAHKHIFDFSVLMLFFRKGSNNIKAAFEKRLKNVHTASVPSMTPRQKFLYALKEGLDRNSKRPQPQGLSRVQNLWRTRLVSLVTSGKIGLLKSFPSPQSLFPLKTNFQSA